MVACIARPVAVLVAAVLAATSALSKFPGAQYCTMGYNLITGDPTAMDVDPGWSSPVFDDDCDGGNVYERSYALPTGLTLYDAGDCSYTASSFVVTTPAALMTALLQVWNSTEFTGCRRLSTTPLRARMQAKVLCSIDDPSCVDDVLECSAENRSRGAAPRVSGAGCSVGVPADVFELFFLLFFFLFRASALRRHRQR